MDIFDDKKDNSVDHGMINIRPLADKMRPTNFDEFVGQDKIVGQKTPLRIAIESDKVTSMILWGPPGTGKTTLAELIAKTTNGQFIPFSAVSSSIKDVKAVISKAGNYYKMSGRRTFIFIDEIHRFNKAQQDAFLPYVEKGDIILIGATTENPSFEVNSALLSRMRVYVLDRLSDDALTTLLKRAIDDKEIGLGKLSLILDDKALEFLVTISDGDARRGLSLLEASASFVGEKGSLTIDVLKDVHQKGALVYDKAGEEHYNLISALHKSIRSSDTDASLYWLARMFESGEEPLYILRRLIRFATEDIGLADPYALTICINARDTYQFLGSPEGELAIAMAVIYMACSPKSNSVYTAFSKAQKDASEKGSLPVPLHIRNAPTTLMKGIGYGKNYQYAHNYEDAMTDQEHFPEELIGTEYYHPTENGREARLAEYLRKYREYKKDGKPQK